MNTNQIIEASLRAIQLLLAVLVPVISSCSASPNSDYYLSKDVNHKNVHNVTATISSDGSCDFSIDGDSAENYYANYEWNDFGTPLNTIAEVLEHSGLCNSDSENPVFDTDENVDKPYMFLDVYLQPNTTEVMLTEGITLDVIAGDTLMPRDNPPGVYFSISAPQTVKQKKLAFNHTTVRSLRGTANLQSGPDGTLTLRIAALGYANTQ